MSIGLKQNPDSNDLDVPKEIKLYAPETETKPSQAEIDTVIDETLEAEVFDAPTVNTQGLLTIDEIVQELFNKERAQLDRVLAEEQLNKTESVMKPTTETPPNDADGGWPTY